MQDAQLYQQILGLSDPWFVEHVDLDVADQRVTIDVAHRGDAAWACPHCGRVSPLHDHAASRIWRHLDTCQFQTHVRARPPRVNCPEHGVCNVALPWAAPAARFTLLMERLIIDVLRHAQNITAACRLTGVSWDQAAHVMRRAVARGLARREEQPIRYLGVDEKRYRRGHVYATVVSDLSRGAVLDVLDGRRADVLGLFYRGLSESQRQAVEAVAMDMAAPYERATIDHLPGGAQKIVYDRFHVMKMMNEALDRVREQEQTELSRRRDDTLMRTKQLWLWSESNLPARHRDRLDRLKQQDLRTARAWAIKEHLRRLWDQPTIDAARTFFDHWHDWVTRAGFKPILRLAGTLRKKLAGVVRFCQHPITTAACEGLNSRIAAIQHRAAGYRRFDRLRQAILFYQGKLNLYP